MKKGAVAIGVLGLPLIWLPSCTSRLEQDQTSLENAIIQNSTAYVMAALANQATVFASLPPKDKEPSDAPIAVNELEGRIDILRTDLIRIDIESPSLRLSSMTTGLAHELGRTRDAYTIAGLALYKFVGNWKAGAPLFPAEYSLMAPSLRVKATFQSSPPSASIYWRGHMIGTTEKAFVIVPTELDAYTVSLPGYVPCRASEARVPGWQMVNGQETILIGCKLAEANRL